MQITTEKKYVTYRHLKKGQEICGYKSGGCDASFSAIIEEINPAFVKVLKWGKTPEEIPSEGTGFAVYMSEDEFRAKYRLEAINIMRALENKLDDYEIGYHEQWNSWISYDIYELARNCKENNIKIIGLCESVYQRYKDDKDIGICVEDEEGKKFWCHASERILSRMIKMYKHSIDK